MSAPFPTNSSSACCAPACDNSPTANVPGPAGSAGINGSNGINGKNAYTLTTVAFVMPAVGATVNLAVQSSDWVANGENIFVSVAGTFQVTNLFDSTHIQAKNLGYAGNVAPATVVPAPQKVSPSGIKGTDGSASSTTLNALSPTTTRGDLIADNGALSPSASDVRLGVGSDGKALVADSSQAAGLNYATITPNASTDNGVPRFDGVAGTPVPLQVSKVVITDDGAIQASGSGGNARGSKAIDLQIDRALATQVASGTNSAVLAGLNNTASGNASGVLSGNGNIASGADAAVSGGMVNVASGTLSCVGAGSNNQATGLKSAVLAGSDNVASATNSTVGGGSTNSATGASSTVAGGSVNTASGQHSAVPGGSNGVANKFGQIAHASGSFAAAGDAQNSRLLARNSTVDATSTVLFLDGSAARLVVPINTAWSVRGHVMGRTSAGVCAYYDITVGIKNNGGVTSLIGAATVAAAVADAGWPGGASVTVSADVANNALNIACVGAIATLVRWVSSLDILEVAY